MRTNVFMRTRADAGAFVCRACVCVCVCEDWASY